MGLQKKIDRERREAEHKKKLNEETAKAIREQMDMHEKQRMDANLQKQQDIANRVSKLGDAQAIEKAKLEQKMRELQSKRVEMRNEYEAYQRKKENQALREKEMDKEFIQRVLAQAQAEKQATSEKSKGNAEDIQNYLAYLEDLRRKEAEKEKVLEAMRQDELEKEWTKRETQWNKEEIARKQLLARWLMVGMIKLRTNKR